MTQTTPVNAWPYPEGTDAPNGAAQMAALALAIEATMTATKAYWAPIVKVKTGATALGVNVVASDPELFVDLATGRTYKIELFLQASGTAAGDIKTVWVNTGTMTFPVVRHCTGPGVNATDVLALAAAATTVGINSSSIRTMTTEVNYGIDGSASSSIRETFHASCTVAGRLTLQWAQSVASGSTTVGVNSMIIATPLT